MNRTEEQKTTFFFPANFSHIYSITIDGIEYINAGFKENALSPTPTKAKGKSAH